MGTTLDTTKFSDLIVERLKGILKENKIVSIYRLAQITGVQKSTLGYIMSGKFDIKANTLHKILDGLGISVTDFFNDEIFY